MWLDFIHDFSVCDLFALVTSNVVVCNYEEGVGAFDTWAQAGGICANDLAEAAEFVGL